jgi:hypothetical protein
MGTRNDKYGKPILEDPQDKSLLEDHIAYNTGAPTMWRPKSVRDRGVTLEGTMEMIDILLKQYESTYHVHHTDSNLLLMPYLFQKPNQGDKLYNTTTKEKYTVTDVITHPITKKWEGTIKISSRIPPDKDQLQKLTWIDDTKYVRFTAENPAFPNNLGQTDDELIEDVGPIVPTVVHALMRKELGTVGKVPFSRPRIVKPRHIEHVHSRSYPGQTIDMRGVWFDNIVQFDCWSTDNLSADKLASWFEKFMSLYTPVLRKNGVPEVRYWQRLRDAAVSKWRQGLESRALQYFLRTEEVEAVFEKSIVQLDKVINLAEEITYDNERWIAGQLVTGQITVDEYNDLFFDASGNYMFGDVIINDGNLT